jgi:hypothetical protein
MKINIITVLFVLCCLSSSSQNISIDFSIEWKDVGKNNKEIYKLSLNAYLVITYHNNTNYPLYFLKISSVNSNGFPPFMESSNYVEKFYNMKNVYDYSKCKYNVFLNGPPFLPSTWEIISTKENILSEHETNTINYVLTDIYNNILGDSTDQNKSISVIKINSTDITEDSILSKLRDNFVFLRARENYTDYYNLFGFQLLGGEFNFKVNNKRLSKFLYTELFWNENQKKWMYKKIPLPVKIKEYNLFSGIINPNNISVRYPSDQPILRAIS